MVKSLSSKSNSKSSRKNGRIQSGSIHVYVRGSGKHTVFYNDEERIEFLKRCDKAAKQYNTKIIAFVLMTNHLHIHVETSSLTLFVSSLLKGFSRWYNTRHPGIDKVFKSPFNSSCKFSNKWISDSILYILANPVKAGMCNQPWEYEWSSYKFYFSHGSCHLSKFIDVDTSIMKEHFKDRNSLDLAIKNSCPDLNTIRQSGEGVWRRVPDSEVCKYLDLLLKQKGKTLFALNKSELEDIMIRLRNDVGANIRQISSVLHESYEEVKRKMSYCFGVSTRHRGI